jgi:hypothetical protein
MRTTATTIMLALIVGCTTDPPAGTQIGALREDPPPNLPTDFKDLDLVGAVQDALNIGGIATLASAWAGHAGALERAPYGCPSIWVGAPPEDVVDLNISDDDIGNGMSWLADCTAPNMDYYSGFTYWDTNVDPGGNSGERSLTADATVTDGSGQILFDFDGEAGDAINGGAYASTLVARRLSGTLVGLGNGLRGELDAEWADDGTLSFFGAVTVLDGFGPPDTRDPNPANTPELLNLPSWEPGMPRFTSVRFDLTWDGSCAMEPQGYVGIRGNEGFWFDVYFLPIYDPDEDTAQSNAFPFEEIDNIDCDGVGTAFARNVSLKEEDEGDPAWTREVSPDFAAIVATLPTPTLADFVLTLRQLPEETP